MTYYGQTEAPRLQPVPSSRRT